MDSSCKKKGKISCEFVIRNFINCLKMQCTDWPDRYPSLNLECSVILSTCSPYKSLDASSVSFSQVTVASHVQHSCLPA